MASASPEKVDDLTVCPICMEQFKIPKYLPCLHSFCEACLSNHINSTSYPNTSSGFRCPTCRVHTAITGRENDPDKVAKQFPLNHLIVSLIDRNHAEERNNAEDKEKLCTQHPETKLDMYCYEHEAPCCVKCSVIFHRSCSKVDTIEKAAKEMHESCDLASLQESFYSLRQNIEEKMNDRQERKKRLQNKESSMQEEIRSIRKKINSHLDELEAKLLQQISHLHEAHIQGVEDQFDMCLYWKSIADDCIQFLDTCQNNVSDVHLLLEVKRLKTTEKEILESCTSDAMEIKDVEIEKNVTALTSDITSFGNVAEVKEVVQKAPRFNFHSSTPTLTLTLPNTRVSSAAFLPNGCVVLIHFWDKKVTLIDVNGNCLTSLPLPCQPWDVTLATLEQIVITLPLKKQLVYINIDQSTLTVHNTMTLDGECRGICRLDQTLLVTYPKQLNVLDLQGNMLDTISVSNCKTLWYVTTHEDRIYLSDNDKHCVLIIDKKGKEMSRYTSAKLKHPLKITTDCEGNIYVVGSASDNIHQLTRDGILIKFLPVDIKMLNWVVFGENSNRFLLSSYRHRKTMIYSMVKLVNSS